MPLRPPGTVTLSSPWLASLRQASASGDGQRLVRTASEALKDLAGAGLGSDCCDIRRSYFLVMFVGEALDDEPALITVLVHDPMPDSAELPGLHGTEHPVYEVFLADDPGDSLKTRYSIAHEENPADKQAGAFVSTVIGKLALPAALRVAAVRTALPESAAPARFPVVVAFNQVVLPEAGAITIRQTVAYASVTQHLAARTAAVAAQQAGGLAVRYGGDDPGPLCADFSRALKAQLDVTMGSAPCGSWPADMAACSKALRRDLNEAAASQFSAAPACPAAIGGTLVQEFAAVLQDTKPIANTTTIANSPLVRYGFGVAAAYLTQISIDPRHPRAQIQSGKLAADPFERELMMGIVNLTPWGYDSQRPSPSLAERARLFVGAAFSPSFGVTGGGAFLLNRYIAVNVGYARLWFDTPKAGESLDAPPTAGNKAAPFDLRSTGGVFVGVSYNFK